MPMKSEYRQSALRSRKGNEAQRGLLRLGAIKKFRERAFLLTLVSWLGVSATMSSFAQTIKLQKDASGINITGAATPFHAGFGNVNGLGIGTPSIGNPSGGLTVIQSTGGVLYYTPYTIVLSGANNGHHGEVRAYISTNFTTSSSVIQLRYCPVSGACTTNAGYSNLPTSAATEVVVLPATPNNGNYTASLGLFVANTNGIAITANDSATVTFDVWDATHNTLIQTVQLKLDTPTETVQSALTMVLASSTGLTVTPTGSTPDFTMSFGNVNGLGINPGAGLTVVNGQVANGALYATPYLIKPTFSGFTSTSSTTISTYVSSDFVHSAILQLYDSPSSGSGYGAISKSAGAPTQLSNSVTSGSAITRYLGLFVSNANGAGIVTGAPETATLTYTITVQ